jgi:hypothetical protein
VEAPAGAAEWDSALVNMHTINAAPHYVTDMRMAIDSDDEIHIVSEWSGLNHLTDLSVGYKWSGNPTRWAAGADPVQLDVPGAECIAGRPRIFLEEPSVGSPILHIKSAIGEHGSFTCSDSSLGWMFHNQRVLSNPDSVWDGLSYIGEAMPGGGGGRGSVVVDGNGVFHLFERETFQSSGNDSVRMVHTYVQ